MTNYLKLFSSVAEQDAFRDGSDYVEPHVSCIEDGTSVKYNKRPIDFSAFWTMLGNTGRMPDKILFITSEDWCEPGLDSCSISHQESNPLNLSSWSDLDSCISGGVYKVVDTDKIMESDLLEYVINGGHYFYFLWELTENGWPEGFNGNNPVYNEKDRMYGEYSTYDESYFAYQTSIIKCLKINGVWYGTGIYGD